MDVVVIALVSFVLSLLATLYPSWRASKINPAEALRYE
jgi:lipoprotein-releasing system permease protein